MLLSIFGVFPGERWNILFDLSREARNKRRFNWSSESFSDFSAAGEGTDLPAINLIKLLPADNCVPQSTLCKNTKLT